MKCGHQCDRSICPRELAGCLAILVTFAATHGCKGAASAGGREPLPALDEALAAQGVEAVNAAPSEARGELAMEFLVELERSRLGAKFVGGWEALGKAPPSVRGRVAAETISDNIGMLDAACEIRGADAMRRAAEVAPQDKSREVFSMCDFGRYGLIDEATAAGSEPMPMVLAHMAFAHIEAHGGVSDDERTLLRAAARTNAATNEEPRGSTSVIDR